MVVNVNISEGGEEFYSADNHLKVRWSLKESPAQGLTVQRPGRQLTF